eukprot:Colp12_sorted_trinity150504_noHs@7578
MSVFSVNARRFVLKQGSNAFVFRRNIVIPTVKSFFSGETLAPLPAPEQEPLPQNHSAQFEKLVSNIEKRIKDEGKPRLNALQELWDLVSTETEADKAAEITKVFRKTVFNLRPEAGNSAIRACVRINDPERAFGLLRLKLDYGLFPFVEGYHPLFLAYAQQETHIGLLKSYRRMIRDQHVADATACYIFARSLCDFAIKQDKPKRLILAEKHVKIASRLGTKQHAETYEVLMNTALFFHIPSHVVQYHELMVKDGYAPTQASLELTLVAQCITNDYDENECLKTLDSFVQGQNVTGISAAPIAYLVEKLKGTKGNGGKSAKALSQVKEKLEAMRTSGKSLPENLEEILAGKVKAERTCQERKRPPPAIRHHSSSFFPLGVNPSNYIGAQKKRAAKIEADMAA